MTDITVPLARILAIANTPSMGVASPEARVLAITYGIAPGIDIPEARVLATFRKVTPIAIPEARTLAVVKGRGSNPRIRAWTFTLDGHDFYVLQLGDNGTLVYDLYSEQWTEWMSPGIPVWRAATGITWTGAAKLGFTQGSAILAGDDTLGLLWLLDPNQPYDDSPSEDTTLQQLAFERIVQGQVPARGRDVIPCNVVFLTGDNYGITATDFTPELDLELSDDGGKTYYSAGPFTNPDVDTVYGWYSLGQITAPGRLFRITDNGVFRRLDSLDMNDDGG